MSQRPLPDQILCGILFCVGGLSLYASRSTVLVLFVMVCLSLHIVGVRRLRQVPYDAVTLWAFAALIGLAGLSALWSDIAQRSIDSWWRVALVLVAGAVLIRALACVPSDTAQRSLDCFCLGIAVLVALLLLEWLLEGRIGSWLKGHAGNGVLFTSHAIALLVVLIWPTGAWLASRGQLVVVGLLGSVMIVVALMPSAAAVLALAMGAITWIVIMALGQRVLRGLLVATWLLVLGAPILFSASTEIARRVDLVSTHSSWVHRLVIWQFFAERIRQQPVLGHGLGRSHSRVDDADSRAHYAAVARSVAGESFIPYPPLHPHNAILQLWHDLGVAGALCALLLITRMLWRAQSLRRVDCAWIGASFVSWMVIACVSFGLWQKWWLAGTGIVAAIAGMQLAQRTTLAAAPCEGLIDRA